MLSNIKGEKNNMPQTKKLKIFAMLSLALFILAFMTGADKAYCQGQGVYTIAAGTSKIVNISEPIKRVSVGNPGIAEYTVLSKNEIILLGVKVGRTELHIWTDNDFKTFIIKVYDDVIEMQTKINEIMGPEVAKSVSIHVAKDTAVLKGSVSSTYESDQVEKIALLYYPRLLNLLEVKDKAQKAPTASASAPSAETGQKFEMSVPAAAPQQQTAQALQAAEAQYPQATIGNTRDILEIKAVESAKETPNSYGKGASAEFSGNAYLPSATIPKNYYESANDKTTRIITLQNAIAAELETALGKLKSPDGLIIKDDRTNSLVLIDKPATIEKMEKMVKIFDAPTPQVLIEAKIVEVSLTDDMKNTLNWIYDTLYSGSNPLSTALNNKSVKISDGTMDFALDYGKISSDHFSMKILPSLQKRHARLISSPSTVTLDKKEATFGVTDNIPYLKYTPQGTTGTLLPTPEYVSPAPGVTLKVTPNINQNDVIRMNINVQIGSFVENVNFGQYGSVPRTSSRQSSNFVEIKNGETLIISGLINDRSFNSANKVPWFAKLPVIGNMFESKLKGSERTELVIFITPKVVGRDSRYAQLDKEKYPKIVENKMPNVDDKFDMKKFLGIKETQEPPSETKKEEVSCAPAAEKLPVAEVVQTKSPQPKNAGVIEYRFAGAHSNLEKTRKIITTDRDLAREIKILPASAPAPAAPAVEVIAKEEPAPSFAQPASAAPVISKFRSEKALELVEKLRKNMKHNKKRSNL